MRPITVASAITARQAMKRDLYAEVSARIVAELERGAAPWVKPWSATPERNSPAMRGVIGPTQDATLSFYGWRKRPAIAHRSPDPSLRSTSAIAQRLVR